MSREVRDLADLGNASRYLGERWEQVGGRQVLALVGQELRSPTGDTYQCLGLQRLDTVEGMLAELSGRGLKSPDCLFAGRDRLGRVVVQPGDFKFTLDIATRQQINPQPVRALLERGGPRFQAAFSALLAQLAAVNGHDLNEAADMVRALDAGRARLLPGFLLAPDEPANRLYMRQGGRRRRDAVTEADVRFLTVDTSFFDDLPGHEVAPLLQTIDGIVETPRDFAAATYYFQLGAAVRGAFQLLDRPLLPWLGPEPPLDVPTQLHAFLERQPATSAFDVAHSLAGPALQRRERLRLAQRLAGPGLRGRPTYEVIEGLGLTVADESSAGAVTKTDLRLAIDVVEAAHQAALLDRLAERGAVGPFADDEAVLTWLRSLRPELEARARAALETELASLSAAAKTGPSAVTLRTEPVPGPGVSSS